MKSHDFVYSQATSHMTGSFETELSIQICIPVLNFALEILEFPMDISLILSQIVSYELSFYYKINSV